MSAATMTAPSPFAGKATSGGGDYELCPAGNHLGRLVAIYDLGTHDGEYNGESKPDQRLISLAWELPSVAQKDGRPTVIGEVYTTYEKDGRLQFGEKNKLRLMLEGWRGRKYSPDDAVDPMAVLDRTCFVNVIHKKTKKGNDIAVIDAIKGVPAGIQAPARHHELVAYHVSMGVPPVHLWLPYSYFRPSGKMEAPDVVVSYSKEKTGKPIGDGKPADTPYSEATRPPAVDAAGPDDDEPPF